VPGMNSGLNVSDPTVVAAFKTALLHQGLIALLIFVLVGITWLSLRAWLPGTVSATAAVQPAPEPLWRQVLRYGFGVIWIFDGILQAQPKMAVGLPSQVIEPTAATSPHWVQVVVNWAGTSWSYHPMQAGAAAVWIQVGIGIWLIAAARGPLSRWAGLVSIGWGLVVWVFGESFGGIFAPGLTWLFGAPGAVLIYCVAGALIALPERAWRSRLPGQLTLAGLGVFLIGMALLQAWPGRGFWQGTLHGQPGSLAGMTASMAPTPQPHFLSAWINAFTAFDEAHGFAVNLFAVVALAAIGAIFVSGRPRLIRPTLVIFIVLCLADWVLIEDLGFLGGLGTDPNSMVPFALLATAGYLGIARVAAEVPAPATAAATQAASAAEPATTATAATATAATDNAAGAGAGLADRWRQLRSTVSPRALASASIGSVAGVAAIGLIILGAAPMAIAQASPVADTILAQAIDGTNAPLNYSAPAFSLTDQHGRTVTLASLRGKVVLMTFLDPVCTSDCPLEAQEFREAGQLLGAADRHVELVAIVANPVDYQIGYTQAFDRQEGLAGVSNWLYLTGSPAQLQKVWSDYGIAADIEPAGSMIAHSEIAFAIDQHGHVRRELNFDPGPGTTATISSFAAELTDVAHQLLGQS
jgi:cytochrome oxidase Cu insertion factor (SCO1/SenC/PrrC family)